MNCSRCGSALVDEMRFCPACGAPIAPSGVPIPTYAPTPQTGGGTAVGSLVLGIVSLTTWCFPLAGLPIAVVGVILGAKGLKTHKRGLATAGLILSIVGLVATLINAGIGAYLGATGQHPLLNRFRN